MLLSIDDLSALSMELATPMIITGEACEAQLAYEWERMIVRSRATTEMLAGEIEYDTYTDIMDEYGVDIVDAQKQWADNQSFLKPC